MAQALNVKAAADNRQAMQISPSAEGHAVGETIDGVNMPVRFGPCAGVPDLDPIFVPRGQAALAILR